MYVYVCVHTVHSSVTGCDTPQYRAVCKNLVPLVSTIKATPQALEDLQTHFKAKFWLSLTAKPDANDLAMQALNRITNNVKDYDVFMEMLSSVTGMDQIVGKIKGLSKCNI